MEIMLILICFRVCEPSERGSGGCRCARPRQGVQGARPWSVRARNRARAVSYAQNAFRAFARCMGRDAARGADGRPDAWFIAWISAYVSSVTPQRSWTARRASPSSGVPTFDSPSAQRMGSRRAPIDDTRARDKLTRMARSGVLDAGCGWISEVHWSSAPHHWAILCATALASRSNLHRTSRMRSSLAYIDHLRQRRRLAARRRAA